MKRILAAITAVITGIVLAIAAMSGNNASASVQCVRVLGHHDYACISGGLYWTDYAFTRQFYWHPSAGLLTATESYYCGPGDHGHTGTSDDWCPLPAPGIRAGTPDYARRVISLADGCVIDGWNVRATVANPPPPPLCVNVLNRTSRPATALEKRSALAFWHVLDPIPGEW